MRNNLNVPPQSYMLFRFTYVVFRFRVSCYGLRLVQVQRSGCEVRGLGSRVCSLEMRGSSQGFEVWGKSVQGSGSRELGSGLGAWGSKLRFRVQIARVCGVLGFRF